MCNDSYNIKVVEGNAFALLFPLARRTYVASRPIDEDLDYTLLQNVKVIIGGVEYTPQIGLDGILVKMPATLERATYNGVITATYNGAEIRAAYLRFLTIVAWNEQSNTEQYIQGSPIVLPAAYVIGGPLTDAGLAELKQVYIRKSADADAAKEQAQESKAAFDAAAEALGNLPVTLAQQENTIANQQTTIGNQQALISQLSGGVIMMSESEYAPALADLATKLV